MLRGELHLIFLRNMAYFLTARRDKTFTCLKTLKLSQAPSVAQPNLTPLRLSIEIQLNVSAID